MVGNVISKLIGLTAVGLASYDTLNATKSQTGRFVSIKQAKRLEDAFLRTSSLDTESEIANDLQNWSRKWHMSDNWLFKVKDYVTTSVSTFCSNFANNFSTLALGAVALLSGKGIKATSGTSLTTMQKLANKLSPIKLPLLGKIAAGLLLVKAGGFVLHNLFGWFSSDSNGNNL